MIATDFVQLHTVIIELMVPNKSAQSTRGVPLAGSDGLTAGCKWVAQLPVVLMLMYVVTPLPLSRFPDTRRARSGGNERVDRRAHGRRTNLTAIEGGAAARSPLYDR